MRKFYSVLAASLLAASAFAQTTLTPSNEVIRSFSTLQKNELRKADPVSNWYLPSDFLLGQVTYKGGLVSMSADTLAKVIDKDGEIYRAAGVVGALGQVVDAHDDAIDLIDATKTNEVPKFSKFTNYSVDSITFTYNYQRMADSISNGMGGMVAVKDTLFIYYFKGSQINTNGALLDPNGQNKPTKFGNLSWDFAKRAPANYTFIDTVILDKSYSTGLPDANGNFSLSPFSRKVKSPLTVNSANGSLKANLVAFAIKFKSGINYDSSYVISDDRDTSIIPKNTKWLNDFSVLEKYNSGEQVENLTFFNTYLRSSFWYPYVEYNGWKGFVCGYAYNQYRYSSLGMFLTTTNVGIREKTDNFVLGNAFPNPSNGAVSISFKMKSNDNVNISVYNLLGAKVAEVANGTFTTGEHTVNANLGNLKAGVYLYTMTTGAASQTQKLIIAE
jgi:hypothetical protein